MLARPMEPASGMARVTRAVTASVRDSVETPSAGKRAMTVAGAVTVAVPAQIERISVMISTETPSPRASMSSRLTAMKGQ